MTRLPTPGGDAGNWGSILNEYLSAVHNTDGSLKTGVVAGSNLAEGSITTDKLADAAITPAKLASSVQTTLSSVVTTSTVGAAGGIASLDSSGKVPASQLPEASGGTTPAATASVSGTIRLTGDLGGSATSPSVVKLNGVSLTGTPSAGQALVATSSTAAGWQAVSGSTNPNAGTVWNTTSDPASGSSASSVREGDLWVDGTSDQANILTKVRTNGQWVEMFSTAKPVVVTPLPAPTGVSATAGNAAATVSFSLVSEATSYTVTSNPGGITKIGSTSPITVDGLANGTSYSFTVSATDGTRTSAESAPSGSVVPSGVSTPKTWLSGAAGNQSHFTDFANWRQKPLTFNRGWADADQANQLNVYALQIAAQSGYTGIFDIAPGGFIPGSGHTWAAAANGDYDSRWAATADKINQVRGNISCVTVSMFHEANMGYPWKITNGAQFKTAFKRYSDIFRDKLQSKPYKIVLSLNWDNTCGIPLADYLPDLSTFDWLGIDIYDFLKLDTQAKWDVAYNKQSGGSPQGVGAWAAYAESIGKPLCFPEWGLIPATNPSFDNPFYIQKMHEFFQQIAPADPNNPGPGELAGEAYYNDQANNCQFRPTTVVPNSAAKYQSLWSQ